MSNIPYQRLDELMEKRPEPKQFNGVKVQIINKPAVEKVSAAIGVGDAAIIESDIKGVERIDEVENDEPIIYNATQEIPKAGIIIDKRRTSLLDRLAILKRIQDKSSLKLIDETEPIVVADTYRPLPILTAKK